MAVFSFAFILRLSTFFLTHNEGDEVIYLTLADKVSRDLSDYTLQGTRILSQLPSGTYDQPLFLRPPLFVYLLALFGAVGAGLWLPLLSGLGVLWLTFQLAQRLEGRPHRAVLAAGVLALCPILLFSSVRILIEATLALLVVATVLLFTVATERRRPLFFALAGGAFGLALLTKETAILILPTLIYLLYRAKGSRVPVGSVLSFGIAASLIALPWYFTSYALTGHFFRGAAISAENLSRPFIEMMVNRSWHFYFSHVLLLAPIYLFGLFAIVERVRRRESLVEPIWALSYLVPLTLLGMAGQGYQTRHALAALPALALLTADGLSRLGPRVQSVAALLLGYGLWTGILNSLLFKPADLYTPFRFLADLLA